MSFPFGETVTRLRATVSTDVYGGPTLDWTSPDELEIDGCGIAPRANGDLEDTARAGAVIGFTLYGPPDADIGYKDRVRRANGDLFEVDGEPGRWVNPFTGYRHGVTAALRRVEG